MFDRPRLLEGSVGPQEADRGARQRLSGKSERLTVPGVEEGTRSRELTLLLDLERARGDVDEVLRDPGGPNNPHGVGAAAWADPDHDRIPVALAADDEALRAHLDLGSDAGAIALFPRERD